MQFSSISRRVVAVFLDSLILLIPAWIASHLLPVAGALAVALFYAPVLESSALRGTIGKYLMGIQVTDLSGRRISAKAAFLRAFIKAVSFLLCLLPFIPAIFTEKRQALHDMIADTIVIYGRNEMSVIDAWLDQLKSIFG